MGATKLNKNDLKSAISKYKEYCIEITSSVDSISSTLSSIPEHNDFKDLTSAANLIADSIEALDKDSTTLSTTMENYIDAITTMDSEKVSTISLDDGETDTSIQSTPSVSSGSYSTYSSSGSYSSTSSYTTTSTSGATNTLASTSTTRSSSSLTESIEFSTNITTNLNGGKGTTESFTLKDGETKNLSTPTKDGYEFLGWGVSLTGPCMVFNDSINTSNLLSEDITLYALWRKVGESDSTEAGFQYSSEDGKWYYYDENGNKVKGEIEIDGKYYYLDDDTGEVCFGWKTTSDGRKCFYNEYGVRESGGMYLPSEDGSTTRNWYYLDPETGEVQKGWTTIDGIDYPLDEETGALRDDWMVDGSGASVDAHNSTAIAKLAIRLACTVDPEDKLFVTNAFERTDDTRAQEYISVMDEVTGQYYGDGTGNNTALASCTQAVGHIIRATVDPDCSMISPTDMMEYMESSDKWDTIGTVSQGVSLDDICEPGDVLSSGAHTVIYLGSDLVKEAYPEAEGYFYEASYSLNQYPCISNRDYDFTGMTIYRFNGTTGDTTHPYINAWKYLDGSSDYVES